MIKTGSVFRAPVTINADRQSIKPSTSNYSKSLLTNFTILSQIVTVCGMYRWQVAIISVITKEQLWNSGQGDELSMFKFYCRPNGGGSVKSSILTLHWSHSNLQALAGMIVAIIRLLA